MAIDPPPDIERKSLLPTERFVIDFDRTRPSGSHPHGFSAIDELARRLGVTTSFHGHHHDRLDYSAERIRIGFAAFGVGLRGITDQDGRVIRVGNVDDARSYRSLRR